MENKINVAFVLRKSKVRQDGKCPIVMRVTINREVVDISTGQKIEEKNWNNKRDCVKGNGFEAIRVNKYLTDLNTKSFKVFDLLNFKGVKITGDLFKSYLVGKSPAERQLIDVFREFVKNEENKLVLGTGNKGKDTIRHYNSSLSKLENFLLVTGKSGIKLNNLTEAFVVEYEDYMKFTEDLSHNTAQNHLKKLKTVLIKAMKNGFMSQNVFVDHVFTYEEPEQISLDDVEIEIWRKAELHKEHLKIARDLFLFCCSTGLSYCDLVAINQDYLKKMPNNDWDWIVGKRGKTGEVFTVPLFAEAKGIIKKYSIHPISIGRNTFFPVPSLKNYNEYLKEIAVFCKMEKNVSSHVARHSFATNLYSKGITKEVISKMLGHRSTRMTNVYAKPVPAKIINEVQSLYDEYSNVFKVAA